MEVLNKSLGSESTVKLVVAGGKISVILEYDGKGFDCVVQMSADTDYFLDQLVAKVPGQIDDAIAHVFKSALKSM